MICDFDRGVFGDFISFVAFSGPRTLLATPIIADSLREIADKNGLYSGNRRNNHYPTLPLRETKQSKGEGNLIRKVIMGF